MKRKKGKIYEGFLVPPYSIIDGRMGYFTKRENYWKSLGIEGEVGRNPKLHGKWKDVDKYKNESFSIFNPFLTEILYTWFNVDDGTILDPFAGGPVRGIVANKLGYHYTGIDIRQEQIEANYKNAENLKINDVNWVVGDSADINNLVQDKYDMVFSCPPYGNLEIYSDLENDISNMDYNSFKIAYKKIIKNACSLLKDNRFAVFVVSDIRNKYGEYVGFVDYTVQCFKEAGLHYYNDIIFIERSGTGALRINGNMKTRKVVKTHQNILVFYKGNIKYSKENIKKDFPKMENETSNINEDVW
jgi:DNA modification methylase